MIPQHMMPVGSCCLLPCSNRPAYLVRSPNRTWLLCGQHTSEELEHVGGPCQWLVVEPITRIGDVNALNALLRIAWSTGASGATWPRSRGAAS